jgi:hemoglobin
VKTSQIEDGFLTGIGPWAVSGLLLVAAGCSGMGQQPSAGGASLYDRLGGKPAITAVVDRFVANVAADRRINGRFATTDIPRLKHHLVNQVCAGSGGPCTYTGRDMKTTHAGMRISEADFTALVEDLVAALNAYEVPEKEKQDLLDILGPMKKDIVEAP